MRAFALAIALGIFATQSTAGVGAPHPKPDTPEPPTMGPLDFAWPEAFRNCLNLVDSPDSCAPIVACVGDAYWFKGRALGRGQGTIVGYLSSGVGCTGTWTSRNAFGLGQADVTCDDGMVGRVFFTYQDELTGTATGTGATTALKRIKVWSGHNIRQFLSDQTGDVEPRLMCGIHEIPLS